MSSVALRFGRSTRAAEAAVGRRAAIALFVVLAAALAGAGTLLAHEIGQREQAALDAQLNVALQAALSQAAGVAGQAQQDAATLAGRPAVQRALATGDRRALARLTAGVPGAAAVPAGSPSPASATPAFRREVRVLSGGRLLGTVSVSVPLDGALLSRLRGAAPLRPGEGFLLVRGSRILAAPARLAGERLPAGTAAVRLAGTEYRAVQTPLVGGTAGVRLAALAPAAELARPVAHAERLLVGCLVATLATLLLLARMLARPALAPLVALAREARSSVTDELTQLPNRRAFVEAASRELGRAARSGRHVAVAMLDVDDFKPVNDTYGHAAGDHVLRAVADVLRTEIREIDLAARLGGEEFAILLPETTIEAAREVAERLRAALAAREFGDGRAGPHRLTVSIGVASAADGTLDGLVDAADRALYRAKRGGKNQVAAEPPAPA